MLELKDGGTHLETFVSDVVDSFDAIIQIQGAYATMNGINIFLCLLRFLKYCDFQPRMGVVTRTLSLAFQDLANFIALLLIILLLYATMGTIVFGSKMEQFSTYIRSLRTVFTWSVLGDDVGVDTAGRSNGIPGDTTRGSITVANISASSLGRSLGGARGISIVTVTRTVGLRVRSRDCQRCVVDRQRSVPLTRIHARRSPERRSWKVPGGRASASRVGVYVCVGRGNDRG